MRKLLGVVGEGALQSLGWGIRRGRPAGRLQCALYLVAGFLLSRAMVLGDLAPFGVALAAAAGGGLPALFASLGAALGYLLSGLDTGLRYIAILILILSAGTVFRGTSLGKSKLFMPLTALAITAVTGFVYWTAQDYDVLLLVLLVTELLLTGGSAYLFQSALQTSGDKTGASGPDKLLETRRAGGSLLLCACLLLTLSGFVVGEILAPARMIAVCVVLLCAYRGGLAAGTTSGLCIGLVMDLGLGAPFYSMSYGSAALMAGVLRPAGKLWSTLAFVCTGAVTSIWALSGPHRLSVLLETFVASVVFMLLPDTLFGRLNTVLSVPKAATSAHSEQVRAVTRQRLQKTAHAFEQIHQSLDASLTQSEKVYTEGVEGVFDRTSKEVCKHCPRMGHCWDAELSATCASLREAALRAQSKGRVDKNDFPSEFVRKCQHIKKFLEVGNREMSHMLYRRQYHARVREGRGVLGGQYAEFGRVLEQAADELTVAPLFDAEAEQRLSRWLRSRQLEAEVWVYATAGGRMCAEIRGENLSILLTDKRALVHGVSRALGWMVNPPEDVGVASLDRLMLWESEPVLATLGIAAHKREGQAVSGDSGAYFKTDEGKLYVILADGMGSGRQAALDSRQAVKLLEELLRAGVSPESALQSMNSALLLKGADNAVFVTLDLLAVDLLEGRLTSYKYGAAPTYIKRGGQVERVVGVTLPGGLDAVQQPDLFTQPLASEQWVVMITDGVADTEDDAWLQEYIAGLTPGGSPREVASRVLQQAVARGGALDDMTVLALRTKARRTRP